MFIVATISKNSYEKEKIKEILEAGATVLRYNFSHGTPIEMQEKVKKAKEVIEELNLEDTVKIMADLPGAKIRLGNFSPSEFLVKKNQEIIFKSDTSNTIADPSKFIPVDYPKIGTLVKVGQEISCADGELGFFVTKIITENSFSAKALNERHIPALKGLNVGTALDEIDHITPKTIEHIKELSKINPDWIAFSFVNSKEYLEKLKSLVKEFNPNLNFTTVSKLETEKAYQNYNEILEETDVALVARGDLGLAVPIEKLGIYQKYFVKKAKEANKKIIVSTQILDSIVNQHTPQRAEVLDLTNIVIDGADGIMLAKETGISLTPGESIRLANKIIKFVEKNII